MVTMVVTSSSILAEVCGKYISATNHSAEIYFNFLVNFTKNKRSNGDLTNNVVGCIHVGSNLLIDISWFELIDKSLLTSYLTFALKLRSNIKQICTF